MTVPQGDAVLETVFQPRCACCDEPAFDTHQLCLQHAELSIFIWRLEKRGEEISPDALEAYMRQVRRPVTFDLSDLPALYQQMIDAGVVQENGRLRV